MDVGAIVIIVLIGLILILMFYSIGIYNKLFNAKCRLEDRFAPIDAELKKRAEIIPKLLKEVEKHAKHEENILNKLESATNSVVVAKTINSKIKALNSLSMELNKVYSLVDTYPELKASNTFKSLQKELSVTEDKINYARSFYNDSAKDYNNFIKKFSSRIVASIFKFKKVDLFEISE